MSQSEIRIFQVDAFTDKPFGGNPAAVCLLTAERDAQWMQAVAAEMNLSETAFVLPEGDGYRLRWFTPAIEVPLCGHATLASAHALWVAGEARGDSIAFRTRSGILTAYRSVKGPSDQPGESQGELIELVFPGFKTDEVMLPQEIADAIGVTPIFAGIVLETGESMFFVELESAEAVREIEPDLAGLRRPGGPCIVVTARADSPNYDFVSRFFAPGAGIDEDPVTGSAHCYLAPYWRARLGKDEMVGYQASKRGGVVGVRVAGDRVHLRGRAVTVMRGVLLV